MRRTKLRMTMAALLAAVLLGGCGEEPYTLTEQEEALIVDYSAHIVTKYNTYQKEGISYVWPEETEEAGTELTEEAGTEPTEESTEGSEAGPDIQPSVPDGAAENGDTVYVPATLTELFGGSGVEIDYVGARLESSYVESAYYAQYPDAGKQYLVLGIDITNTGTVPVKLDYVTDTTEFQVTLNDEVTSSAEITILTEDFSAFEGTLAAGETRETVLLFQVPATITTIEKVALNAIRDTNYQIILENE